MPDAITDIQEKLPTLADSAEKVDLLNELSLELRDNDTKAALEAATRARALAETLGYQRGLGYSLRNIATCLYFLSDFASALDRAFEALQLFQQLDDKQGAYRAMNTVANVYYRLGDHTRSLEYEIRMLSIAQELNDPLVEATARNNIGLEYLEMDDYDQALVYFQKSLDLYAANGHAEYVANPMMNIGIVQRHRKQYDTALEFLNRSLETRQQQNDLHGEVLVWYNIGAVHFDREEFVAAVESYQRCIEIAQRCGDRKMEANALMDQARAKGRLGLTAAAFDQMHRAQELLEQIGDSRMLPELYRTYAELFERTEDYRRALEYQKKFSDTYEQQHTKQVEERLRGLRIGFEADQTRKEGEIYRLRNVELTKANQELEQLNRMITKGEEYRSKLMEQVAAQAQQLEQLAKLDGLTGLYNRRYLDEALEREFARAKRYHDQLTVAMLDIDNFKQINDSISHHAGDEVLKIIAGILKANCRTVDLAGRYGGEEFVLAFPNTGAEAAGTVCERIRAAIEQFFWTRISKELQVTISIGLCDDLSLPSHEKLLSAADQRMYRAKQQGRNRVVGA